MRCSASTGRGRPSGPYSEGTTQTCCCGPWVGSLMRAGVVGRGIGHCVCILEAIYCCGREGCCLNVARGGRNLSAHCDGNGGVALGGLARHNAGHSRSLPRSTEPPPPRALLRLCQSRTCTSCTRFFHQKRRTMLLARATTSDGDFCTSTSHERGSILLPFVQIAPPQLALSRPTRKRASRRFSAQPRRSRCGMQLSTSHRRCRCDQVTLLPETTRDGE